MITVTGTLEGTYKQLTKAGKEYAIHQFMNKSADGKIIIQRVKDYNNRAYEIGKKQSINVFVTVWSANGGSKNGYELVAIPDAPTTTTDLKTKSKDTI